ncbi:MAG: IMP cyclohydrolase [Chloroflexi bacterium]|nr:IMP cyclohydrolase [Chloroflexota bacterium]
MYIGRFVVAGRTAGGHSFIGYRVSSRSFPNRIIRTYPERAAVLPTQDAPPTDNPYIAYNCYRQLANMTVIGNGSQVDPISERLQAGYPPRDALAQTLLALDYEHDALNTPRIAAVLDGAGQQAWFGFVGADKLYSRVLPLEPGQAWLIATYELTEPTPIHLPGEHAEELADALMQCEYDLPVAGMAVVWNGGQFAVAARSVAV